LFDNDVSFLSHRSILGSSFGFFDDLFDTDTDLSLVDFRSLRNLPLIVNKDNVANLLCFVYDDHILPGVSTIRNDLGVDKQRMSDVIELAIFFNANKDTIFRINTVGRCLSCQKNKIERANRVCQDCWNGSKADICGNITEDMVLEETSFEKISDECVDAICSSVKMFYGSKTCDQFKKLLIQYLGPARSDSKRLSTLQATRIQDALLEGKWCPVNEVIIRNMMLIPGEFKTKSDIPFPEDGSNSLKKTISMSTGRRYVKLSEEMKQKCVCSDGSMV
jgi:hypothetical protein